MKLVTWTCKGAFSKKHTAVAALEPDILVVPESEKPAGVANVLGRAAVRSVEWVGDNPKKGLAVLSYGDYYLDVHEAFDPRLRWVLPLKVAGPVPFTLFAVWTVPHEESGFYVQCLFEALEAYANLLGSPRVVWAGDFNNSFRFDRPSDRLKFSDFVNQMSGRGLQSLYHLQNRCAHGEEPQMTFFLHHHVEKGHHIDFIFATQDLFPGGFEIAIGEYSEWARASDHMPLACSFHA